jgi:predicted amidohydrolase YtcJ
MAGKTETRTRTTLVSGGPVLVLDGKTPAQEALVYEGGHILAVGPKDEMKNLAGPKAEGLDLNGAALMPGIIDSHPHALHWMALELGLLDLKDAANHDDIVRRIKEKAQITPPGEWIVCSPVGEPFYYIRRSWRDLEEGFLPDRCVLDQATTKHPVVITALAPRTPSYASMNSVALEQCHITSAISDKVCSVEIFKDHNGRPTGILRGPCFQEDTIDPFWLNIRDKFWKAPDNLWETAARRAMSAYNRLGVTAVYEGHAMTPEQIRAYQDIADMRQSTLRVLATVQLAMDPASLEVSRESIQQNLELGLALTNLTDPMMRVNGVTLDLGGPGWPGFLRMREPYLDPEGKPTRGRTFVAPEYQEQVVRFCAEHNLRLNMVMGGYQDHDDFLRLMDAVAEKYDIKNRDWVIQHSILINEDQVKRYAELECQMTTSTSFVFGKGDIYGERMGKHVWKDLVPLRRMLSHGLNVGLGTDWGPMNYWEQMKLAQTHEFAGSGHRNLLPGHAISREEALLCFTRNNARAMQWDKIGSLVPGYWADMIVVDQNPMTVDVEEMHSLKVLKTILGGETVYDGRGV